MRSLFSSPWARTLLALVVTAAAVALRWLLDPWLGERLALVTLFAAVATAVWLGGYRPACLAAVLGYLACNVLFVAPRGRLQVVTASDLIGLCAYLGSSGILIAFGEALRRAHLRAQSRQELLRTTLASIGDAVLTTDPDGRVTSMNPVAEALTGWSQAESLGAALERVFRIENEETGAAVESPATQALRLGIVVGLANHTVLIARDGSRRAIDDSAAPIRDEHGQIVGCVLVFRDITERRAARQALQRSEENLSDFFEHAGIGLHWAGPDGVLLRVNRHELDMLGYAREEYVGRHFAEFHAERAAGEEILAQLACGQAVHEHPARLRAKDGSLRDVLISSNVYFQDGRFVHTRCFTVDVTERKRAEARLRESEALFRTMGEALPNCLWMADASGRVLYQNPACCELVGRSLGDQLLSAWQSLLHPEDLALVRQLWPGAVAAGASFRVEARVRRHDGEYRWFAGRSVPLADDAGRVSKWIGTLTDIHDLKQAEEALRAADRRKDEFLAILAHELRNPLAPVRNSLEILKRAEHDLRLAREARSTMERQVAHMERLIDDLLDISRITRNRLELRRQRIELGSVLQHALETCRPLTEAAGHALSVLLPPDPIWLDGDAVRLAQVFGNLLGNAAKYTEPGGHIRLGVERRESDVTVSVQDDGMGIPPALLPRIFEMFAQVDRTRERSQGGLGIGLSLVKRLVELHGGSVQAFSAGPGQGSEFVVRLPILDRAAQALASQAPPPSAAPAPARRILVVDDNQDSAQSLALLLRLAGHHTQHVCDGLEAVAAAERFRPDVVLLDLGLPRLSGFDVCRRIRARPWGQSVFLVALTGWGQAEDRRRSQEAGFDAHLVKPVDHDELARLLSAAPHEAPPRP